MAVFRVEKTKDFTIMSNHHLRNVSLSLKAKGLISLMLSLPEDWDYTTKGLARICKDGVDSICATLKELEKHGYLTRQRIRNENGRLGDIEYIIHEQPVGEKTGEGISLPPKLENPEQVNPKQAKPDLEKPDPEKLAQLNTQESKTEKSNTHISSIHQSIPTAPEEPPARDDWMDRIDMIFAYRHLIKENIEYDCLMEQYGAERMDEVLELILETVLSKRPYIRIAGDELPHEVVKSRLLKVRSSHLQYVFNCLDQNTTKVYNIKSYLLTALFNAPVTMGSFYRAEVNHDMYGI